MADHSILAGLLLAGTAAASVWLMGFPIHHVLVRWNLVDRPNERSSHSQPTARGGGIAILLVFLGVTAATQWSQLSAALLGTTALLAVVSLIDDLRTLPALVRFGCHALCALVMLAVLGWPQFSSLPVRYAWLVLAFLWVTGYTNAFNFMDGINGLAAGQAAVTGLGMALLAGLASGRWAAPPVVICLVLAGAALGFLPHNFPRARMFMGDVGSAATGFLLAILALWLARDFGWWLLVPFGLLHANFVLDTGFTLARRVLRGDRWYEAHREHFYQRLIRAGKSHARVTLLKLGLQLAVLGLLCIYLQAGIAGRWLVGATIVVIWAVFFAWAEASFRREQAARGASGRPISGGGISRPDR